MRLEVVKQFREATHSNRDRPSGDMERVEAAMKLEAAKIMVDEGSPATAIQLIKEVGVPKKRSIKKGVKRKKS